MNLMLHMVRNDLVRMRGWIACWVGVLLLPIGLGTVLLTKDPLGEEWGMPNTLAILTGLQLCIGYLLTIVLVHEHGLVGTRQFWLTRPISRGRLLGAKAIGALIIVGIVPVLVSVPWWWWCGLGIGAMAQAALETIAALSIVIVAGALVAALTESFARALLWTAVLIAAGLSMMVVATLVDAMHANEQREMALLIARTVAAVTAVTLVLAATVVVQFFVRRRGWWLGVAGLVLAGAFMAAKRWPWPWVPERPQETNPVRAPATTVRLERIRVASGAAARGDEQDDVRGRAVNTRFVVSGVPEGLSWSLIGAQQTWTWADGSVVQRSARGFGGGGPDPLAQLGLHPDFPSRDPETKQYIAELQALAKARGALRPPEPEAHVEGVAEVAIRLPASLAVRAQAVPPDYRALVLLRLSATRLEAETPLAPGGRLSLGSGKGWMKIKAVERETNAVKLAVLKVRPMSIRSILRNLASTGAWFYAGERVQPGWPALLAIDRAEGDIRGFDRSGPKARVALVNGVEIEWANMTAKAPRVVRGGKWVHRAGWVEGAVLGLFVDEQVAELVREVTVARVEIAK